MPGEAAEEDGQIIGPSSIKGIFSKNERADQTDLVSISNTRRPMTAPGDDPRKKFRIVKELLHPPSSPAAFTPGEDTRKADTLANYFRDKVMKIRSAILQKLGGTTADAIRADHQHNGGRSMDLHPVHETEVLKLLSFSVRHDLAEVPDSD